MDPPPITRAPVPPRPGTEYLVLLPTNPRQPGVQGIAGYRPIQAFNQQGGLIRPILLPNNAPQIIRAQPSSSGVMPTNPTSQAPITTMASIPNRHIQIPISAAGSRGPITLTNGPIMSNQLQRAPGMAPRANILQSPGMMRNFAQPGMGVHSIITTSHPTGVTSMGPQTPTIIQHHATSMSPEDALAKGKSFMLRLLTNLQSNKIQNLIQTLIDGGTTPAQFATELQTELNSPKPQAQLVPFLELLLPILRQSMMSGQTVLPGIRPPGQQIIVKQETGSPSPLLPTASISPMDNSQMQSTSSGTPSSSLSSSNSWAATTTTVVKKKKILPPGQKTPYAIKKEAREARKREREASQQQQQSISGLQSNTPVLDKLDGAPTNKDIAAGETIKATPKPEKKRQEKQKKQLESLSSALRDDDDVNDVAAMGGVNLAEESQKIMASGAELVGTQIRSCKDEPFLDINVLTARISKITLKYDFPEPSPEVVTLISHATQERLKTMVERLGILAEHRSDNLKFNPKYEMSADIKGQVKFLAELDRIERRRNEEQEREQMLKIAKSRSKVEDPEQQKLRQKAKDMQRAEQEEVRQREANETALLAIGPRKKLKSSQTISEGSFSQSSFGSIGEPKQSLEMFRNDNQIKRIRRVNMRDLQTLLELDRTHLDRLIKLTAQ